MEARHNSCLDDRLLITHLIRLSRVAPAGVAIFMKHYLTLDPSLGLSLFALAFLAIEFGSHVSPGAGRRRSFARSMCATPVPKR